MTVAPSRHTGPPTTAPTFPSSSAVGTYYNKRERKLTFASEWYFKPEGVNDVKKRFEVELRRREIEAQYEWSNTEYIFRVRCLASEVETIWPLFQTILRTIIKEEGGDIDRSCDYDSDSTAGGNDEKTLTSNKIENLAAWEKQHRPRELTNDEPPKPDPATSFPDTVRFYKFRKTWSLPIQGIDKFDVVIPDGTIMELSKLTDCQLAKNTTEGLVYIGSYSEEAYLNVISRLDNILKLFLRLNQPYMNHMFYSEEADNAKFTLNTLINVKKAYFETTLLDNLQMSEFHDYNNLHQAVTVRLASFDRLKNFYIPIKNLKFGPAISAAEKDLGTVLKQWVDFKYCPKGEPTDNPLRQFPSETGTLLNPPPLGSLPTPPPHSTTNTATPSGDTPPPPIRDTPSSAKIEQWASEIPVLVPLPSNQPPRPAPQAKKADWDTVIEVEEYDPYAKPKNRNPNPTNKTSSTLAKNLDAINAEKAAPSVTSKEATLPVSMVPLEPVRLNQNTQPSSEIQRPTPSDVSPGPSPPTPLSKPTRPVNPDFVDSADHLVEFFNHKIEHSLLDDNISIAGPESDEFKVLQPAKRSDDKNSNTTARQSGVVPQILHSQPEKIQYVDEVATRTFHNTMNQMAPKPKKKPNSHAGRLELPSLPRMKEPSKVEVTDPLPEFVQVLEASFAEMMKGIQGFRGKIVVQAEFGRVLLRNIKPSHLTSKERDHPLDAMFLHHLLTSGSEAAPLTFFTKPLTVLPADIQYLVEMKGRSGNDLWEHRLFDWDVKYEFFCQDQKAVDYTPFTIEIDGEKFDWEIKTRRDLGNVYINGAKRHWDVRISATGYEINKEDQQKYAELASAIEASLYIPPDLQKPAVYFELENSLLEKYDLDGVRVHRISRYKSTDQNSILEVRECRDLDVGKMGTVFRAISNIQDRIACEKLDYWHEVNISSGRAEEALEANTKLALGEEAAWNLSEIKAAEHIYLPALQMLKQMDGVGWHNDNGIDARTVPPPPQQPRQNYVFW